MYTTVRCLKRAASIFARWIEVPGSMKRAGHLVAQTRGTRGKRLLLLGHLDTVLVGERFRRDGTRASRRQWIALNELDDVAEYRLQASQRARECAD